MFSSLKVVPWTQSFHKNYPFKNSFFSNCSNSIAYVCGVRFSSNYIPICWKPWKYFMQYVVLLKFVQLLHWTWSSQRRLVFISYLYLLWDSISFLNSRAMPCNSQALWYFCNGLSWEGYKLYHKIPFSLLTTNKDWFHFQMTYSHILPLTPLPQYTILKIVLMPPSPTREWHIKWYGIFIECIDI